MGGGLVIGDFFRDLRFSQGVRSAEDRDTIRSMLPGCVSVVDASTQLDMRGVDYIATLEGSAQVFIDGKTRTAGCSKFWTGEPEPVLELWSKKRTATRAGVVGWTLRTDTPVDMILYTWDSIDTDLVYLVSYQHLRAAFVQNGRAWCERYGRKTETTRENGSMWQSECVFVPASEILRAITSVSVGLNTRVQA